MPRELFHCERLQKSRLPKSAGTGWCVRAVDEPTQSHPNMGHCYKEKSIVQKLDMISTRSREKKIIIESIQTGRQWPSLFQWSRIIFLFRETSVGSRPLHNTPKNSPRYVIERIIYIIRVDGSFPLELARKT